ncbi:chemotaxis protein CheA [Erythrobacteraceae bacterium E2-1 Yellow Sea]|nr:chemotaxis protein CheA [Erythrobacteraceae bacterium E2-1 Yellow Sea]
MDDLLADFVAETREMLEASESELIAWEQNPGDRTHLDAIFRFFHTVKGNCGFFDFPRLEKLSHAAEDVLADIRAGRRVPDAALVTAILAIVDRIGDLTDAIEAGEEFPHGGDERLINALNQGDIETSTTETEPTDTAPGAAMKRQEAPANLRSIRLPVELLDRVMSGVSDMVLARNDLAHRLNEAGTQPSIDGPFERLSTILTDVRDAITRMRMQRIEALYGGFPRLVRDLSSELGKQVMIDLEGGDVELDREMIEMIRDPMTHIIRNAIDHGIEKPADRLKAGKREIGLLAINTRQAGNKISIVVSDDGRGLDESRIGAKAVANGLITADQLERMSREEILQLVFAPGLSTAEQVSSVSGRGVGLDVVRDNLEKVGGSIRVTSTSGTGSLFFLTIPLTLSIISGLSVETGGQRFAIPQSYVEEIVHMGAEAVDYSVLGDSALVTFRGQRICCLSLADVLGLEHAVQQADRSLVILRLANGDIFALAVDHIHNIADMVIKPLPAAIMDTELYGGSTLLDNGTPVLLLDVPLIAANAGLVSETRAPITRLADEQVATEAQNRIPAVLFTGHDGRRMAVRMELVQRIETISNASVERSGGSTRAVVDGEILPLIGLNEIDPAVEKLRLLRLSDGYSELLFAVQEVSDATRLDGELVPVVDDDLIEAMTLVEGDMVSLLDGHALFSRHGALPKPSRKLTCSIPDNDWARKILAPLISSAGYALANADADDADIVIALDNQQQAEHAMTIRLRSQPDSEVEEAERANSIYRYDRDGVLAALRSISRGAVQ